MRKDVKLGFAIGGVLLAVVVVYVLVVPNSGEKPGTQLTNGEPTALTVSPAESTTPTEAVANENSGSQRHGDASSSTADTTPAAPTESTSVASASESAATSANRDGVDWGKLLNGSAQLPPMMTQTPNTVTAGQTSGQTSAANTPTTVPSATEGANTPTPTVGEPTASNTNSTATEHPMLAAGPTTVPTATSVVPSSTSRTHVVRTGETLSSIAAAAYGDARYYPYIKRANPTLDERKLKVGMVINLPEMSQVHGAAAETSTTSAAANPKEYRVQAGDSLYRISIKLYGNPSQADRIYEMNKAAIGSNPAALKVNTVLKLPEAIATASR